MQLGMVGLGRMGAGMARRLMRAGHACVVTDQDRDAVDAVAADGAVPAYSLAELVSRLERPRSVWLMIPAAVTGRVADELAELLEPDDTIIDGGNSNYRDAVDRQDRLRERELHHIDVGTSGGIWGLDRGYCLMVGGDDDAVERIGPVLSALAPGTGTIPRTSGRTGARLSSEEGWLHCGPAGAGHFVKMIHNGIEYAVMASYAEGFNLLRHAGAGLADRAENAETAPLVEPKYYRFDFDLAEIAELWRRGSVISSWLLDLTAEALHADPDLAEFSGTVADSGEGRWTSIAAIEEGVPAPLLTTALYSRFASRGLDVYANKVLSAQRKGFGGHLEQTERVVDEGERKTDT
jgi:6-phosphogluconate dehydrogenase